MAQEINVAQLYAQFESRGLNKVNSEMNTLRSHTLNLKSLLGTLGGAFAVKQLVTSMFQATKQLEDYRMRIRAVSKTVEQADATFQRIKEWAEVNPVNTDDAIAAFVRLRTAAVQNAEGALQPIADLASVMGRRMEDVAGGVVTMNARVLRQLGVIITRESGNATIRFGDVTKTVKGDIDSTRAALLEVLEKAVPGAMERMKNTATGTLNTMGGMWQKLMTDIMGFNKTEGIFAGLTGGLVSFREQWENWMKSNSYQKFLSNITSAAKGVSDFISTLWQHRTAIEAVIAALMAYKATLIAVKATQLLLNSSLVSWISLIPTALTSIHNLSTYMSMLGASVSATNVVMGIMAALLGGIVYRKMKLTGEEAAKTAEVFKEMDKQFKNADAGKLKAELAAIEKQLKDVEIQSIKTQISLSDAMQAEQTGDYSKVDESIRKKKITQEQQEDLKRRKKYLEERLAQAEEEAKIQKDIDNTINQTPSSTKNKGKSAIEKAVEQIDMKVKYANYDIAQAKANLEEMLNNKNVKPFSDDWKALVDKIKDYDNTIQATTESKYELGITKGITTAETALQHYIDELKTSATAGGKFATEQERVNAVSRTTSKVMSSLQNVISEVSEGVEKHKITTASATETLNKWKGTLADIPAAVKQINDEISKLRTQGISDMVTNLTFDVERGATKASAALELLRNEFSALMQAEKSSMDSRAAWSDSLNTLYSAISDIASKEVTPSLEMLQRQFDNGTIRLPQYLSLLDQLKAKYADIPEVVKQIEDAHKTAANSVTSFGTRMSSALMDSEKAVNELGSTALTGLVDGFSRAISYGESFGDSLKKLAQDVAYTITKMLILKAVMSAFGIGIGGIGGGNVYSPASMGWTTLEGMGRHTGGIAGVDSPTFTRMLPKFHTGGIVGSQEQLSILKKGEGVFTEGQMRAIGKGMSNAQTKGNDGVTIGSVIMNVRADDADSFRARMADNSAIIESVVIKNIMGNGTVRGAIKTALA